MENFDFIPVKENAPIQAYKSVLDGLKKETKNYSNIKLVISDVDGVLTDGGMYYSENGDELKKFNTHDGIAFGLLKEHGIKTAIITSDYTKIVERRAKKLNVDFLMQGKSGSGKLEAAKEICGAMGVELSQAVFIGDDINDIELLQNVGFAFCPADAQEEVKAVKGIHRLEKNGGCGVFREMVRIILKFH